MFRAGSSTVIINPHIGDDLSGGYERRFMEGIRDNLEANAFYITDGTQQVLLINLDHSGLLEQSYFRQTCDLIEATTGIPARNIIIHSTHTHAGPDTMGLLNDAPVNIRYLNELQNWIKEAAERAVNSARSARVGWGEGQAHIGYNRRVCWADGSHSMYGDLSRPDFTGIEGPDDPSHTIFFAIDEQDKLIAIMHGNCCHATCLQAELRCSADYPGEARKLLRMALSEDLPVLYLQGASGDIAHWNILHQTHQDSERRCREMATALASETMRLISAADPTDTVEFNYTYEDMVVQIRFPEPDVLEDARKTVELGEEQAGRYNYVNARDGIIKLQETYQDNPVEVIPIHALRIGDYAIITNPCELFCRFGLDIKDRSPAKVTAITQLADGYSGYVPTIPAIMGGGYSAFAKYWCRLEPYAGYKIVECSAKLLHQLWH